MSVRIEFICERWRWKHMKQTTKHVLFVGNSYTYFNDMPEKLFKPMAEAKGYSVEVTAVTAGGYYFSRFADPSDPEGQRLRRTIEGNGYDAIILQEQSCYPVRDVNGFCDNTGKLKALLAPHGNKFFLYCTWGRRSDNPMLAELHMTSEQMTEGLSAAYNRAAQIHGMTVAEVGKAFADYAAQYGQADLYDPDGSHPSLLGSRIAAEVLLDTLETMGVLA